MPAGDRSERELDKRAAKGEDAPGWLPLALGRMQKEVARIESEEQQRLGREKPGSSRSVSGAAARARRIKEGGAQGETRAWKTNLDLSKAWEVFVACGLEGRAADVKDPTGKFNPGYLGRRAEIELVDDAIDVFKGIDFLAKFSIGESEHVLGLDVTSSPQKLAHKFGKIQRLLEQGEATSLYDVPNGPVALRLVIGISSEKMREIVREWCKEGSQVEAYDEANAALGACIREQIMVQLTEFKKYAESVGTPKALALAARYGAMLAAMKSWVVREPKENPLKADPLHQEILKWARGLKRP